MNLFSGLSKRRSVTSTKNSQKSQNQRPRKTSNQNKSKKSTEEMHSSKKEPASKKMPLSSSKSTQKMLPTTETINSENSKYQPEPSQSITLQPKFLKMLDSLLSGDRLNNTKVILTSMPPLIHQPLLLKILPIIENYKKL